MTNPAPLQVSLHRADGTATITNAHGSLVLGHGIITPGELLLGALAACELYTAAKHAERNNIALEGLSAEVTAERDSQPRRITAANVVFEFLGQLSDVQRDALLAATHHCPIGNTLTNSISVTAAAKAPAATAPASV